MDCKNCSGLGAIPCPEFTPPPGAIRGLSIAGNSHVGLMGERCLLCNGLKQVQCPACKGKAMDTVEENNIHGVRRSERRMGGGTHSQNLLAIHYLLKSANAKENNARKAKFASFLTGFSENTFRQEWSKILSRAEGNPLLWEKDMKTVRQHFQDLDLLAVVKLIDNDLESQSE